MKEKRKVVPVPKRLLTPVEAAQYLNVAEKWLARDRVGQRRVPFIKVSTSIIRYELSALDAFIAQQRRGGAVGAPSSPP